MKTIKTFLILFLLGTVSAMAQNAKGQFSVKPMAGVSVSTFSGSATGDVYHSIARPTGGLELEFGATEWLGVSLGISYSQLGAKVDGELWGGMVNGDGANFYTAPMKVSSGIYSVVMRMDGHVYGDYLSFPLVANIYILQVKGLSHYSASTAWRSTSAMNSSLLRRVCLQNWVKAGCSLTVCR